MIELSFDTAEIERHMARVEGLPYAVQRVLYPAVAEVLQVSRSFLSKHLTTDVPLPPRDIERSIKLGQPRIGGGVVEGEISLASKPIPLIRYAVTPAEVTARKGLRNKAWPGFTYQLRAGEIRQRGQLEGLDHMAGLPFIAAMSNRGKGGHLGVYFKTPGGQIKELYGPRIQYHAATPELEEKLLERAGAAMGEILPRMVDRAIEQHLGNVSGGAS